MLSAPCPGKYLTAVTRDFNTNYPRALATISGKTALACSIEHIECMMANDLNAVLHHLAMITMILPVASQTRSPARKRVGRGSAENANDRTEP